MSDRVWFATAQSPNADTSSISRFREDAIVSAIVRVPNVQRLERYMAFNLPRIAVVALVDDNATAVPEPQPVAGIACRVLSATSCAVFVQPGERDPIANAPILYSVLFNIPPEWHDEFDAWYDQEHMPMILSCREWAMTSRYHVQEGPWTHLALHYIKSAKAFDDDALKKARLTPWRKKFIEHSWFTNVEKMIHFHQANPAP